MAARQDERAAALAERVRAFVRPRGDERALDVGTGAGALGFALAPLVREVVGLDPVPELLELARARALPNTDFVEGDGTALPFPDDAFDLAGTHRTLHHVAQPERIVAELARVTRPGGRVLVVDQLAPDDATVAATLHEFETARDSSHTRLLTDGELLADLGEGRAAGQVGLGLAELEDDLVGRVSLPHRGSPGPAGPLRLS